jgi:phospholipid/cholesterol/gamma-HCH transport system permease protein
MRVNEELDALVVMGIDPVPYLAVSRVLAGIVSVPLLAVFFELFGIFGGLAIWLTFGYSPELYLQQLRTTILLRTVFGAVAKTVTFGAIAALLGCFYGLRQGTSSGARAVAEAATRAVVAGMVVIACTDAAFAVLFYFLKV